MRTATLPLGIHSLGLVVTATGLVAEPFELKGTWWREPAQQTRHTTLVASFDSAEDNDADYARALTGSGGFGMTASVLGKHGSATQVAEKGGHVHFAGGSNFQAAHGTVRMWVKGDAWTDKTLRWFFDARGYDRRKTLQRVKEQDRQSRTHPHDPQYVRRARVLATVLKDIDTGDDSRNNASERNRADKISADRKQNQQQNGSQPTPSRQLTLPPVV